MDVLKLVTMQSEQVAWAEEFSRWSGFAAPVTISFSSAVRTVGAQPYLFCWFPFYVVMQCTWWYATLFGCCVSLELSTADSFHGCMQLFITPQVLFSFVFVHCWHCCCILLLLFINECFWILRMRGLTFDLSVAFLQSVISCQYFCPCRACVRKLVDSK